MAILALYIPKPQDLAGAIALLTIVLLVLCGCAYRMRLSVLFSAIVMAIGATLALAPDLLRLWNTDLGDYGDVARKWSSTDSSDTFFAITMYMDVGLGKLVAFSGMAAGLIVYAVIHAVAQRKRRTAADQETPSETELQSTEPPA